MEPVARRSAARFGLDLMRRLRPPAFALVLMAALLPAAQAPRDRSESFVAPDGVRIRYLVQGSGTPLVLLHGFALSGELNWVAPGALDSLAGSFTVIVPDLRGHGQSEKPHDASAYGTRFEDDVLALLDHLRIPRAHVAGYSLGAVIALRLAVAHPDRVSSAVLGGGGWQPPDVPRPPFFEWWREGLIRAARGEISVSDALQREDMPAIPAPVRAALDRNDPAALGAALGTLAALGLPEVDVQAVKVPLHAVVGEKDPARRVVDRLGRLLPTLTVTTIPGADHAAAMAHPGLAAAIRDFARTH